MNFKTDKLGTIYCTLVDMHETILCNPRSDECLFAHTDNESTIKLFRTESEQYYMYQKGKYNRIKSNATFIASPYNEIIQLLNPNEVHTLLESTGELLFEDAVLMVINS